jgi:hypothetical protein
MKMTATKPLGRVVCDDDPKNWVQIFTNDPRLGTPTRFIVCIDGRIVGFQAGERTKTPGGRLGAGSEFRFFPFDAATKFYPIRHVGVQFVMTTFDENYEKVNIKTTHSKFSSREQQDRAIAMLTSGAEVLGRTAKVFGEKVKFSEDIWERLERGNYIYLEEENTDQIHLPRSSLQIVWQKLSRLFQR